MESPLAIVSRGLGPGTGRASDRGLSQAAAHGSVPGRANPPRLPRCNALRVGTTRGPKPGRFMESLLSLLRTPEDYEPGDGSERGSVSRSNVATP
jgi:hypothetical protein